jgi:hypothetical protein
VHCRTQEFGNYTELIGKNIDIPAPSKILVLLFERAENVSINKRFKMNLKIIILFPSQYVPHTQLHVECPLLGVVNNI